jgi:hypothetical protein
MSHVKPFTSNDDTKFPGRSLTQPGPIDVDGVPECEVDRIIDCKAVGSGYKYLVRWTGYGPEHNEWIAGRDLEDNEAMDWWLELHPV